MMESVITWGSSVCVFAVTVVLFKIIFPQGNIKKAGETLMVLLMLFVMLQPFTKLDLNSETFLPKTEWYDYTEMQEKSAYDAALKQAICNALTEKGIDIDTIQIHTETDAEQYLILTSLELKTDADTERILSCLQEELDIPAEIVRIDR